MEMHRKDRDDSGWIPFRRAVLCGMGEMVVDQIRVVRVQVTLQSGENEIGIYAGTPGFLLEN